MRSDTLRGKTALITGRSSGLGRATALEFATAGADVAVLARGAADLQQTVDHVRALGARTSAAVVDLADAGAVERVAGQVHSQLGGVDVLVNGADVPGPAAELDVAAWDLVLAVNLRASFLLAKAAWPDMRERGSKTIVNVSSVAGRRGWTNASAYCAAKFGLTGLTQALAAEGRRTASVRAVSRRDGHRLGCVVARGPGWLRGADRAHGRTAPATDHDHPDRGRLRWPRDE